MPHTTETQPEPTATATGPATPGSAPTETRLIEEELVVEEISIDGMCGVY
jgi:mycofactocin precursor